MLAGHYPLGFRPNLHHKDLSIALKAESVQLTLPISALVKQQEAEPSPGTWGRRRFACIVFDAES